MQALTPTQIDRVRTPGVYRIERSFYLRVQDSGRKTFIQRTTVDGRKKQVVIGAYPDMSVERARALALMNRAQGIPAYASLAPEPMATGWTFAEFSAAVFKKKQGEWKPGSKSAKSWQSSMGRLVLPKIGHRDIRDIEPMDIIELIEGIGRDRPEQARVTRNRIKQVFGYAIACGKLKSNPAGPDINDALTKRRRAKRHHPALPPDELPAFIAVIRDQEMNEAQRLAMLFTFLTVGRITEILAATWDEIDLTSATWTVPGERMKKEKPHRVPLSPAALDVLVKAKSLNPDSDLIFPGKGGAQIGGSSPLKAIKKAGFERKMSMHGVRSGFRSWCAETSVPFEVSELALAHAGDALQQAYQRSDLLAQRREVMNDWARYIMP